MTSQVTCQTEIVVKVKDERDNKKNCKGNRDRALWKPTESNPDFNRTRKQNAHTSEGKTLQGKKSVKLTSEKLVLKNYQLSLLKLLTKLNPDCHNVAGMHTDAHTLNVHGFKQCGKTCEVSF